jgi:ribosomal protein S16
MGPTIQWDGIGMDRRASVYNPKVNDPRRPRDSKIIRKVGNVPINKAGAIIPIGSISTNTITLWGKPKRNREII